MAAALTGLPEQTKVDTLKTYFMAFRSRYSVKPAEITDAT